MKIQIRTPHCPFCGEQETLEVDAEAYRLWREGMNIQDAFPLWIPEERELLITGIHPQCWNEMTIDEDDEAMVLDNDIDEKPHWSTWK